MIEVAKYVRCCLVLSVIIGRVFVPLDQRSFKRGQTRHELALLFGMRKLYTPGLLVTFIYFRHVTNFIISFLMSFLTNP